jgi:hypothetical protein
MDISSLALSDVGEMQLKHPVTDDALKGFDDKNPIIFLISGTDSEAYRAVERFYINKRINSKNFKRGKLAIGTAEEQMKERLDKTITCLNGWRNFGFEGQDLPFSADKAREILSNPKFSWILEQIESYMSDRENFIKGS